MRKLIKSFVVLVAMAVSGIGSAVADPIFLNITWSGASFGNNASATGVFGFESSLIPNVGFQSTIPLPNAAVSDLAITISGASSGNGTFGMANFGSIYFATPSGLNFTQELIGQLLSNGCTFGTSTGSCGNGLGGDFNLFGSPANGTWYFQLTTASGENMLVTSMTQHSVPEPGTLALLAFGLAGIGFAKRRKT